MKLKSIQRLLALCTVAATTLAAGSASAFTGLYVFGDSLSDSGNNAALFGTPAQTVTNNSYVPNFAYSSGTYSNGPVWVNSFAAGLGLASFAAPSRTGGGDYAHGGAQTNVNGPLGAALTPSTTTQVNGFLAPQATIPSTALYVVATGGNDARAVADLIAGGAPLGPTIAAAAAAYALNVGNIVDSLQAKGATSIIVWDTPNLGKAPAVLAQGALASGLGTQIATSFNAALASRLSTEIGVTTFDVFGLFNTIAASPATYGLTNISDACGAVAGCDPNKYLFWDGIHPTSGGHRLIANAMLAAAVPEPSSMLLLAVGIVGLMAWRRRV
jgi:outer membrane lipase/esterase